jgi:hypothetical protein
MDMFSVLFPTTAAQLNRIEQGVIALTASIDQVRADYKAYATDLKDQRDAAIALAEQYAVTAQENADALAAFQADDAATDASQLAQKEAEDAAAFQSDLDELKAADEPVEPDDTPHVDNTLPGDLPPE